MGLSFAAQAHTPVRWYFNPRAPCGARPPRPCPLCPAGPYFNPRAPCGARLPRSPQSPSRHQFQSTRPLRGATGAGRLWYCDTGDFNPRAPCGARLAYRDHFSPLSNFNPRAPCGARLPSTSNNIYNINISIHAPLAGRDAAALMERDKPRYFNPRAPCGARRRGCIRYLYLI